MGMGDLGSFPRGKSECEADLFIAKNRIEALALHFKSFYFLLYRISIQILVFTLTLGGRYNRDSTIMIEDINIYHFF
jgi:hypothetical protein